MDYLAGKLSDESSKRKKFALIGYAFSTLAKLMLLFANSLFVAGAFRIIERLGKSFRGPPRDAWIASMTNKENRGLAFGIHKAFDKAGAILGPLIAYVMLKILGQSMVTLKLIFLVAFIPAVIAVFTLIFIKEKNEKPIPKENIFLAFKTLSPSFKKYLLIASFFSIAYFSYGFLLLKAYLVGFSITNVVLLYAFFNLFFVLFAVPFGKLGNMIGRKNVIKLSYLIYALLCFGLIFADKKWEVLSLFALFGIFYSIDESQTKAYIFDLEIKKRGSAIGVYNLFTGVMYLLASVIAGVLWTININYAFVFSGVIAVSSLILLHLTNIE